MPGFYAGGILCCCWGAEIWVLISFYVPLQTQNYFFLSLSLSLSLSLFFFPFFWLVPRGFWVCFMNLYVHLWLICVVHYMCLFGFCIEGGGRLVWVFFFLPAFCIVSEGRKNQKKREKGLHWRSGVLLWWVWDGLVALVRICWKNWLKYFSEFLDSGFWWSIDSTRFFFSWVGPQIRERERERTFPSFVFFGFSSSVG